MSALKRFTPNFLAAIDQSARNIFGNLPITNYRTGLKLLRRKPIGPLLVQHYPHNVETNFRQVLNGYKNELEERRESALIRLRRRSKGPPKKGQGKRAGKKK